MDWQVRVILSYDGFYEWRLIMHLYELHDSTHSRAEKKLEGFWPWLTSGFAPLERRVRYAAEALAQEALAIEKRRGNINTKAEIAAKLTAAAQTAFEQAYRELKERAARG